MLGRHAARIALAKEFGATDIVSERGDEAIERQSPTIRGCHLPGFELAHFDGSAFGKNGYAKAVRP